MIKNCATEFGRNLVEFYILGVNELAWEAVALPTELLPHFLYKLSQSLNNSNKTNSIFGKPQMRLSPHRHTEAYRKLVENMVEFKGSYRLLNWSFESSFLNISAGSNNTLIEIQNKSKASFFRDGETVSHTAVNRVFQGRSLVSEPSLWRHGDRPCARRACVNQKSCGLGPSGLATIYMGRGPCSLQGPLNSRNSYGVPSGNGSVSEKFPMSNPTTFRRTQ